MNILLLIMNNGNHFLIEDMNGNQIRKKVNDKTVAILILGSCENHGDHLPLGSDFIFPLELAKMVAKKIENLIILPPIPYGVSSHHKKFFLTISLDTNTLINLIQNLLDSLYNNGIYNILIINGHDGNIGPIEIASRNIKDKHPRIRIACLESWWELIGKLSPNTFKIWDGLGHGGEAETSAIMKVKPELVDVKNIPEDTIPNLPKHLRIYWTIDELTNTGATGSSKSASADKGELICKMLADILISFLTDMERTQWKYGLAI